MKISGNPLDDFMYVDVDDEKDVNGKGELVETVFGMVLVKVQDMETGDGKYFASNNTPTGVLPRGNTPAGVLPQGNTPTGVLPRGSTPAGVLPRGSTPAKVLLG